MRRTILWSLLSIFVAVIFSVEAFAQEEAVESRRKIMKANSADTKAIQGAIKSKDYATVQTKAKEIMEGLDKAADLFPKGSVVAKSRAHPDIWEKPDEFKKRLTNARNAAERLNKAAAAKNHAEVEAQAKALGSTREGACGECHEMFRADFRKAKK